MANGYTCRCQKQIQVFQKQINAVRKSVVLKRKIILRYVLLKFHKMMLCEGAKNVVLFNREYAKPTGTIKQYKI